MKANPVKQPAATAATSDLLVAPAQADALAVLGDGRLAMSTLEIAKLTGKLHAHVLRDARAMLEGLGITESSFGSSYRDSTGRSLPVLNLPKDLTYTLVSGYSVQMRHRIVTRWMELEKPVAQPDLSDPAALRGLLLGYTERVIALEAQVAKQAPMVAALDRIAFGDGDMTVTEAAKTLGMSPRSLFTLLADKGWIYRQGSGRNEVWLPYQAKCDQGLLDRKVYQQFDEESEKVKDRPRLRVTRKGLTRLAQVMSPAEK